MAKRIAYPGKLNKPLEPRAEDAPSVPSDEYPSEEEIAPIPQEKFPIGGSVDLDQLVFEKMWRPEFGEKLELLCEHFKIRRNDPDKWALLQFSCGQNLLRIWHNQHMIIGIQSGRKISRNMAVQSWLGLSEQIS